MPSYLETSMEIAREAGALLANYFEKRISYQLKGEYDLVTDADRASERLIVERLRAHFPSHSIVAEEGGGHENHSGEYRWYVDPLDGTTNFAHGFPHFCVSIALCDQHGARLGVIHDPIRGETFVAVRGQGARLDRNTRPGRALAVSQAGRLQQALIATGFSYQRATTRDDNLAEFCRVVPQVCCVRRAGSAALDLAYVAAGRLDAYWEYHLQPWDVAAGSLLVHEAGGQIRRLDGAPWQIGCADVVAAGPTLLPTLLAELRAAKIEAP